MGSPVLLELFQACGKLGAFYGKTCEKHIEKLWKKSDFLFSISFYYFFHRLFHSNKIKLFPIQGYCMSF